MQTEQMKKAIEAGVEAAMQNLELGRVKKAVSGTIEDGLATTQRALKRGRHEAEELIETAEHSIKQHPMRAVSVTFGIGIGLGAVIGLLAARNGHS